MSSSSMSSGEGLRRSSLRPDSMRCQARGAFGSRPITARHDFGIETVERIAESIALPKNGDPRKPGLEAVEQQLLEQRAGIIFGNSPFIIVITHVQWVAAAPETAQEPVLVFDQWTVG